MKFRAIIATTVLVISVGCVSSEMMATGAKTYPPRPEDYVVDVFSTTDAPVQVMQQIANLRPLSDVPKEATEIGRVDAHGAPAAQWGSVVDEAKKKARMLGGDGIVVNNWGSPISSVGSYGEVQYAKALSVRVIRFKP